MLGIDDTRSAILARAAAGGSEAIRLCSLQGQTNTPVAQLAEQRSPKPQVGGSSPSWRAIQAERNSQRVEQIEGGLRKSRRSLAATLRCKNV